MGNGRELAYKNVKNLRTAGAAISTDVIAVLKSGEMQSMTLAQLATFIDTGGMEDLVLSGATPTLQFKDTDCDDTDINAQLDANATATGTGVEDIDVTLKAQQAGTLTTIFTYDASADTFTINRQAILETATPSLQIKDSSCDDADVNAQLLAAATATGTGAEDIDVTLSAQQGGTLTSIFTYDASADTFTLERDVVMADGKNIATNATTGSSFGNAITEKISFYGVAPVVQQSHVIDPSGGGTVDAESRTAINAILVTLETYGWHATS